MLNPASDGELGRSRRDASNGSNALNERSLTAKVKPSVNERNFGALRSRRSFGGASTTTIRGFDDIEEVGSRRCLTTVPGWTSIIHGTDLTSDEYNPDFDVAYATSGPGRLRNLPSAEFPSQPRF